jgi:DNA-binding Lrp family transcriptional regulator
MKSAAHSADAVRFTTHDSRLTDAPIDEVDRRIILATQAGLPLTHQPYHRIATELALEPEEVMERIRRMLANGVIRRIGAVPNHYALGYRANAMSVWDVPDTRVRRLGQRIGELHFVSHCYRRPRHLPYWPYNLFAMVHGHNRAEVEAKAARIAELLGRDNRGHAVLYSTRILKKTGLRIGEVSAPAHPAPAALVRPSTS